VVELRHCFVLIIPRSMLHVRCSQHVSVQLQKLRYSPHVSSFFGPRKKQFRSGHFYLKDVFKCVS
jgi:hypothetical protein